MKDQAMLLQLIALVLAIAAGVWHAFATKIKLAAGVSFVGLAIAFLAAAELLKSCAG
jgi:hypothetical protein